jgi:hypothetical protein
MPPFKSILHSGRETLFLINADKADSLDPVSRYYLGETRRRQF